MQPTQPTPPCPPRPRSPPPLAADSWPRSPPSQPTPPCPPRPRSPPRSRLSVGHAGHDGRQGGGASSTPKLAHSAPRPPNQPCTQHHPAAGLLPAQLTAFEAPGPSRPRSHQAGLLPHPRPCLRLRRLPQAHTTDAADAGHATALHAHSAGGQADDALAGMRPPWQRPHLTLRHCRGRMTTFRHSRACLRLLPLPLPHPGCPPPPR